jgi:hypothetical protein
MREHLTLALLWMAFGASTLLAQGSPQANVLRTEDRRFAAMVDGDTAVLRTLLADDLSYTHTSGKKDDRTAFLQSIASGQLRYRGIAPTERRVRLLGADAAVVTGRSDMRVESEGQPSSFAIRYVAVYERKGAEWQLLVWQATRLP